mmetsp:Transcript_42228/g.126549  ORF Transcript_42228/g.126549 Transcript_42228/m.126549 type:complete len:489 (-) Transcript_42228:610-2076(-)
MSGARPVGMAPKALPHARGAGGQQPGGTGVAELGDRERRPPGKAKKKKSKAGRDAAAGGSKRGTGTASSSKKRKKPGKGAASSVDQMLSSSLRTLKRMDISGVSNSSSSRDDTPPAVSPQPEVPLPLPRHRSAGPGPGSSAAARSSTPAVVCIPPPSSDSPDSAPRRILMKAAKQGAQGVPASKKKRQKLQHSVADGVGDVGGPPVRGGGRLTGDASMPTESADVWYFRCRRTLLTALDEHCYSVIARSVATWPAADIHRLCSEWEVRHPPCACMWLLWWASFRGRAAPREWTQGIPVRIVGHKGTATFQAVTRIMLAQQTCRPLNCIGSRFHSDRARAALARVLAKLRSPNTRPCSAFPVALSCTLLVNSMRFGMRRALQLCVARSRMTLQLRSAMTTVRPSGLRACWLSLMHGMSQSAVRRGSQKSCTTSFHGWPPKRGGRCWSTCTSSLTTRTCRRASASNCCWRSRRSSGEKCAASSTWHVWSM